MTLLSLLSRNAILTSQHQRDVLDIIDRCHTIFLEPLCSIFNLCAAPVDDLVELVRRVLDSSRIKEAVVLVYTFGLQDRFSMEQVRE